MASAGIRSIQASLIGDILIAMTKASAAVITGSSSMLSETVHSIVDSGNQLLLLYGIGKSRSRPDAEHPLGYGRELYFWSFIVALLLFGAGACVSIIEGITRFRHPVPIDHPAVSYAVLGMSLIFEAGSLVVAFRIFRSRAQGRGYWAALRESRDPSQTAVLLEGGASIVGILIALVGTWLAVTFEQPRMDGIASILIGINLTVVSAGLARQSKRLLIGERADEELRRAVFEIARATPGVVCPNSLISVQLAPHQVVGGMSIEFDDSLSVPDVEAIVADLEDRIRKCRPELLLLFVKPQTKERYNQVHERLVGQMPA